MSKLAQQLGFNSEADVLAFNARRKLSQRRDAAIEQAQVFTTERPKAGVKGVIRQSGRQMNKTEARFEQEHLKPLIYSAELFAYDYEAVTLRLANGCRYTPDFWAISNKGVTIYYEIKARGNVQDDSVVKLKVAASKYVNCEFYLCAWDRHGWTIERVLA